MKEKEEIQSGEDKRKGINPVGVNIRTEKELADDLLLICQYRKKQIGWRTIAQMINSVRDYELNFIAYYNQYHDAKSNVQKEALASKDELIEAELTEIDWQISELTAAWKRSIGTKQKTQTKITGKGKPQIVEVDENEEPVEPCNDIFLTEWDENGDPRYMAEITKLRERRAKLLGIDAPEKKDVTVKAQFSDLTDEQLSERLNRIKDVIE